MCARCSCTWGGGALSLRLRFLLCLLSQHQLSEGLQALAAVIMVNFQTTGQQERVDVKGCGLRLHQSG